MLVIRRCWPSSTSIDAARHRDEIRAITSSAGTTGIVRCAPGGSGDQLRAQPGPLAINCAAIASRQIARLHLQRLPTSRQRRAGQHAPCFDQRHPCRIRHTLLAHLAQAPGADPFRLLPTRAQHEGLQAIGRQRIERHRLADRRLARRMQAATTVVGQGGTSLARGIVVAAQADRQPVAIGRDAWIEAIGQRVVRGQILGIEFVAQFADPDPLAEPAPRHARDRDAGDETLAMPEQLAHRQRRWAVATTSAGVTGERERGAARHQPDWRATGSLGHAGHHQGRRTESW